jgi:hypothetical protein
MWCRAYTRPVVRTFLAAVLAVALLPLIVLANLSIWASGTVLDEPAFAATVSRSLEGPAVETLLAEQTAGAILDVANETPILRDALVTQVLGLDVSAPADQVRTVLDNRVRVTLDRPLVREARDDAVAAVHALLVGGPDAAHSPVAVRGTVVVLDLGPLVSRVVAELDPRLTQAGLPGVPPGLVVVELGGVDELRQVGDATATLDRGRIVAPLLVAGIGLLILVFAHRRMRAVGLIGGAVMIGGLLSLAALWFGGGVLNATAESSGSITDRVAADAYGAFASTLADQSLLLVAGGGILALAMAMLLVVAGGLARLNAWRDSRA